MGKYSALVINRKIPKFAAPIPRKFTQHTFFGAMFTIIFGISVFVRSVEMILNGWKWLMVLKWMLSVGSFNLLWSFLVWISFACPNDLFGSVLVVLLVFMSAFSFYLDLLCFFKRYCHRACCKTLISDTNAWSSFHWIDVLPRMV